MLGPGSHALAQAPSCGPVPLDAGIPRAERTEILVLGTQHLRRIEAFDPAVLERLLGVLEAWGPDAIGVETLPPWEIAAMESRQVYAPVLGAFASDEVTAGRLARESLGLDWSAAQAAADSLLGEMEAASPGDRSGIRRRLVPALMAAYRLDDAILQWSHLRESPGGPGDALPDTLRSILEQGLGDGNETTSIGIALARRLGHERVLAIDDHLDKDLFLGIAEALSAELETSPAYRELLESGALEESTQALIAGHASGDLLPFYLDLNDPSALERDLDLEWGLFFRTRLSSGLDRMRVALWETRNLAMAQHVRRASARFPGGRVLVVVGASHKPFLDAYLACGMDVEMVQLTDLVRGP